MTDSLSLHDINAALALIERLSGGIATTPERLSPFVESFCRTLCETEPVWVPVITMPYAEPGRPAKNVAAKIGRSGGSARHGWAIWEHPGISLSADFHVVWLSERGDLFDVTPAPHDATRVLFLPDHRYEPGFAAEEPPLSRVKWINPGLRERFREPAAVQTALRDLLSVPQAKAAE